METVHTENYKGCLIEIFPDDSPFSPEENRDENLFLTGFHRDFSVEGIMIGRTKTDKGRPLASKDDCIALAVGKKEAEARGLDYPAALAAKYHTFGLEAYIHSGVVLALSHEGNFPDRQWDVSQLGLVFVAKSEWKTRPAARKAALGLIEEWNNYLSGNIYGFRVTDADGVEIDSCWGFSGDYDAKGGILDEARGIVDHYVKDAPERAQGAGI